MLVGGWGGDINSTACANDEDSCRACSEQKAQTQRGFQPSSPKGQGPKNPFHLARDLGEGRGGGGSGPGSASQRPCRADLPRCSAWPPASAPAIRLPYPRPEWSGTPLPHPHFPVPPGVRARAPEARRLWPDGDKADCGASPRLAEFSLWRRRRWGGGGSDGAGRSQGKRDPKPDRRFPSPHSRLSPCPNCLSPVGLTLCSRPLSAANFARNLDPRPGKSRPSSTPPRHLPSGLVQRLRARACP